ncbi:Hpt domain-containing protein [Alkalimonas delamerensis]|uniref:Hpt domain-containing protein n=1 Tax=Alkalimonas delamerensis TaxID=265981 RepID=A0ABT9GNE5_9GAMM|nr:Hpt domain-containing protein [Alkalimonas delamerensis]MDP4528495.1 Hpt domain-containing protein [Alkalimonas delamerensis]
MSQWDKERFLQSLGPMQNLAPKLLQAFLTGLDAHLTTLAEAQKKHDRTKAQQAAHSIKGIAGQVGCLELAAQARQIEEQASTAGDAIWCHWIEQLQQQAKTERQLIEIFLQEYQAT